MVSLQDVNSSGAIVSPAGTDRNWVVWAGLLVALYIAIGLVGWNRTLIPDEIRPLLLADNPLDEELEFIRSDLLHTPLSFMVQRMWLNVFGHTDTAAKSLALLLNVPTLIIFTWLARKLTTHWRLTAFLFSTPFLRIGSAVNLVRMYGLLLLLVVIALVVWELWRRKPTNIRLAAWAAVMTLTVYTHGTGLLLLPVFVLMNWFFGSRSWLFTAVALVPCAVLLVWIAYVFPVYQSQGISENMNAIQRDLFTSIGQIPFFLLSGEDAGGGSPMLWLHNLNLRIPLVLAACLAHVALVVLAWPGIRHFLKNDLDHSGRSLCIGALTFGIPITLLAAFSILVAPVLQTRYVLLGLPGYWLMIVLLGHLGGCGGRLVLKGVVLPWVLVSIGLVLAQNWNPSPTLKAAVVLAGELRDSDLILCDEHMPLGWQFYWEWTHRLGEDPARLETLPTEMPRYLTKIPPLGKPVGQLDLTTIQRIWFLYSHPRSTKPVSEFLLTKGFSPENPSTALPSLLVFKRVSSIQD